jgi:hypothetical protein
MAAQLLPLLIFAMTMHGAMVFVLFLLLRGGVVEQTVRAGPRCRSVGGEDRDGGTAYNRPLRDKSEQEDERECRLKKPSARRHLSCL